MRKYGFLLLFTLISQVVAVAQRTEVSNLGSSFACAHERTRSTHEVAIGFANNSAHLDASYRDNAAAIREVEEFMRILLQGDCGTRVIIIDGAASPLGKEEYNKRLALRRAEAVRDFLHTIEGGDRIRIHAISDGEDWESFTRDVVANYNRPNREKVLEIIRSNYSHDEKEEMLRRLDKSGETFRILVSKHMAESRNAALVRIIEIADLTPKVSPLSFEVQVAPLRQLIMPERKWVAEQPVAVANAVELQRDNSVEVAIDKTEWPIKVAEIPTEILTESISEKTIEKTTEKVVESVADGVSERKLVMAVRSNLLVPALNVGVEVPIGKHWSVGADYYFPWIWPKKDNINCFEFLGWGIEGRYWFGKNRTVADRLRGHSLGVYGYMGYYDFERNFHGHQGEFVNLGVDYTFAMAVGKKKAVHFEFSLGVGYISIRRLENIRLSRRPARSLAIR